MPTAQDAKDSSGQPIDREFYKTFWGLQAVFQLPYSIIEPSAWAATISNIHKVLAEFQKQVRLSASWVFWAYVKISASQHLYQGASGLRRRSHLCTEPPIWGEAI